LHPCPVALPIPQLSGAHRTLACMREYLASLEGSDRIVDIPVHLLVLEVRSESRRVRGNFAVGEVVYHAGSPSERPYIKWQKIRRATSHKQQAPTTNFRSRRH